MGRGSGKGWSQQKSRGLHDKNSAFISISFAIHNLHKTTISGGLNYLNLITIKTFEREK